ncbi:hypothetical protein WL42_18420 [Burkholderia ubonensis]|nr:hypothetical protein WL42_18420 [Burkholderia ubonensis]
MGGYVLPCVDDMMTMPLLAGHLAMWRYKTLDCGIDPIDEIIRSYKNGSASVQKTSFLKELGRAAYSDAPHAEKAKVGKAVDFTTLFDRTKRVQAERLARAKATASASEVDNCPVCGLATLVVLEDLDGDFDDGPNGETWRYTYRINCVNCTLDMIHEVGNASAHGLPSIKDFWTAYKLS